jgi:hypothetical protein
MPWRLHRNSPWRRFKRKKTAPAAPEHNKP